MLVLQQDRTHTNWVQNKEKALTWRNMEVKSKYHSNAIFAFIDQEDLDEIKEWTNKSEEKVKLMELPKTQDFQ